MSLTERIDSELKASLLAREKSKVDVLRLLKAAIKNEMINLKSLKLTDEEAVRVLRREAKKRLDSIIQYRAGKRNDLCEAEEAELKIIKEYLPDEMGAGQIEKIVKQVINLTVDGTPQFGFVMKAVMRKIGGQADGALVSSIVKKVLAG